MLYNYRGTIIIALIIGVIAYTGYKNQNLIYKTTENGVNSTSNEKIKSKTKNYKKDSHASENLSDFEKSQYASKEYSEYGLSPSQVEDIVKNFLEKNPEVVANALDRLQQIRMDQIKQKIQSKISENTEELQKKSSPILGNKEGNEVVVMFYDYNCGYCKQSNSSINNVISSDKDLKVILKVYPILGNESEFLARITTALNLYEPNKFEKIHNLLMSDEIMDKNDLENTFKELGIDFKKFENIANSEEVTNKIKENINLAKELNINGVPAFIINGNYHPGYLSDEQIRQNIKSSSPSGVNDDSKSNSLDKKESQDSEIDTKANKKNYDDSNSNNMNKEGEESNSKKNEVIQDNSNAIDKDSSKTKGSINSDKSDDIKKENNKNEQLDNKSDKKNKQESNKKEQNKQSKDKKNDKSSHNSNNKTDLEKVSSEKIIIKEFPEEKNNILNSKNNTGYLNNNSKYFYAEAKIDNKEEFDNFKRVQQMNNQENNKNPENLDKFEGEVKNNDNQKDQNDTKYDSEDVKAREKQTKNLDIEDVDKKDQQIKKEKDLHQENRTTEEVPSD